MPVNITGIFVLPGNPLQNHAGSFFNFCGLTVYVL